MESPIRPQLEKVRNDDSPFPTLDRPFRGDIALGNGSQFTFTILNTDDYPGMKDEGLFVSIDGRGAYSFKKFLHFEYVKEKLGLGEADSRNVADLINSLNHNQKGDLQGHYQEDLCE